MMFPKSKLIRNKILYLSRKLSNLLYMIFSKSFDTVHSNDTGL